MDARSFSAQKPSQELIKAAGAVFDQAVREGWCSACPRGGKVAIDRSVDGLTIRIQALDPAQLQRRSKLCMHHARRQQEEAAAAGGSGAAPPSAHLVLPNDLRPGSRRERQDWVSPDQRRRVQRRLERGVEVGPVDGVAGQDLPPSLGAAPGAAPSGRSGERASCSAGASGAVTPTVPDSPSTPSTVVELDTIDKISIELPMELELLDTLDS